MSGNESGDHPSLLGRVESRSPTPTFEEMVAAQAFSASSENCDPPIITRAVQGVTEADSGTDGMVAQGSMVESEDSSRPRTPELSELLAEPVPVGPRGPLPPLPPQEGQCFDGGRTEPSVPATSEPAGTSALRGGSTPGGNSEISGLGKASGGYATLPEAMTAVLQQQLMDVQAAMAKAPAEDGSSISEQLLLLSLSKSMSYDCKP